MRKRSQLWLPKLTEFERVLRKVPQPRINKVIAPKRYEILYHPLDLRFRGRIGMWVKTLEDSDKINLSKILSESEVKLFNLYFYPQGKDNRWKNQAELLEKFPNVKYWKFRSKAVEILLKIWEKSRKD